MPIETKTLPVPPWRGLFLDGVTVPGGMSRADNVCILPDGSAERRLYQRTLDENPACLASRGLKSVYELRKADGTRYLFADVDNSDTAISSFGSELISHFATWTPTSGWTYGSSIWTHTTGTTALVATGETAIVAASKYRIVVDITQTPPSSSAAGWTYTSTDSGLRWVNKKGNKHIVWMNSWTHAAGGGTTALTTARDFTVIAGQTYRIIVHVTHSAGTSLSVYIGGKLAGTIAATGLYEYVVPFVTDATALRFVPTSDWAGSIDKTWPRVPNQNDAWISVQKFINPAGANIPSNIDTGSTHIPISLYDGGRELLYVKPVNWYPEEAAQLSQSIAVYLGGTLAGVIQASGEYAYDVTATTTAALTFTPTTSWAGSVNGASVKVSTLGAAATKLKVIGGEVTGTTDYEVSWSNILTNLTTGAAVLPAWATMQDRAFRVDGTNINYYFRDASDYHTLGVPAPIDAPVTVSSSTSGELTSGTYNIYYTYVKKDDDYIVEGNPSPASNTKISGLSAEALTNVAGWTATGNWTYGAGAWSHATGDATALTATGETAIAVGTTYEITMTLTTSTAGGGLVVSLGGVTFVAVSANDTYTFNIKALTTAALTITPTAGTWVGGITGISLKTDTGTAIDVNVIGNSDPDITHIRIYRTLYNEEGSDAYYEREVLNATKTVTITDSDDTIGDGIALEYNRDMPKRAMFVMTGGSRLWLLRFPGEVGGDSMMMWSEVGHPEYFPALNYQAFDPDDGDVIMGGAMMQNNILVFKRHRTWICDVYSMQSIGGVSSIARDVLSPTIGCIASGSIQSVGIDQAIWLSAEGVMLYDGGRIRNISKDKINSVINHFMANGAEYYIDSVYHSTKRQYHINFIYRTGAVITSQRHFVYSMDANPDENDVPRGAWTEYVYTDSDGTRFYEINFCLASDSNLMEVILIPYLVTTTDTVAYIYQTDYELPPTATITGEWVEQVGPGRVSPAETYNSLCWSPKLKLFVAIESLYGGTGDNLVFSTSEYGVTWTRYETATGTGLEEATFSDICWSPELEIFCAVSIYNDAYHAATSPDGTTWTLRETPANCTMNSVCWSPELNLFCGVGYYGTTSVICTSPNGTNWTRRTAPAGNNKWWSVCWSPELGKFCAIGYNASTAVVATSVNGTDWTLTAFTTLFYLYSICWSPKLMLFCAVGEKILTSPDGIVWTERTSPITATYRSITWSPEIKEFCAFGGGGSKAINSSDGTTWAAMAFNTGSDIAASDLKIVWSPELYQYTVVAGYESGTFWPDGYWEIRTNTISEDDTEPTMRGAVVNIVSNYTDLGIANDKRIKRVYLDTESQYATCGAFTLEPGYNVNVKVHETDETSEPTGATSLRPFAHPGRQTWEYTNDQFDSTSEAWLTTRLDVGVQGKKFRYSVKIGDVPSANHGILRIRPPMILVQVKETY